MPPGTLSAVTTMTDVRNYQGPVRILDTNGWLLTVGMADLAVTDPRTEAWGGTVTVFRGAAVDGKSLTVLLEVSDGTRAKAQLGADEAPAGAPDLVAVKVVGLESPPF